MKKHKLSLLTTLPILIGSALAVCVGTITPVLATYYNVIEDNFFLVESGGYTFKCFNITDAQEQPVANSVAIAWGQNAEETPETFYQTFNDVDVSQIMLVVPDEAADKYRAHEVWGQFRIETPTGINHPAPAFTKGDGNVFNLAGQRLSTPLKGINIVNGRKVLIK